ncbi:MAG: UbiA family prenyltransferase [archaeon]
MERFFAKICNKNKILCFFEVGRPWNGILLGLLVIFGMIITKFPIEITTGVLGFLAFLILYMGGSTLNDIYDFKVDKINMPYRPLQRGSLTIKNAKSIAIFFYVIGLILAINISLNFFWIAITFTIISLLYSVPPINLVRRSYIGSVSLSIVTIFLPCLGGSIIVLKGILPSFTAIISFILYTIFFLFVILTKDFKDIKGDEKEGKKTVVLRLGKKNTVKVIIFGITLFYILLTFFLNLFMITMFFTIFSFIILLFILKQIVRLSTVSDEKEAKKCFTNFRIILFVYVLMSIFIIIIENVVIRSL